MAVLVPRSTESGSRAALALPSPPPVPGTGYVPAHGFRSVHRPTECRPNRVFGRSSGRGNMVSCGWQPGHPIHPAIPEAALHKSRTVPGRSPRRPNVDRNGCRAGGSPSMRSPLLYPALHSSHTVFGRSPGGPNVDRIGISVGRPAGGSPALHTSHPVPALHSSRTVVARELGRADVDRTRGGAGAIARYASRTLAGCVQPHAWGAWWAWAPSDRPLSVARARSPPVVPSLESARWLSGRPGCLPCLRVVAWQARFPFVPSHQDIGDSAGLGRAREGGGEPARGAGERVCGGRDESVRRGAGSQWIMAARPLCHLQCPVAYLSRLQRIQPAARWEGSFEAAGRGASAGPAWPVARALGGLRP
ncbi:hypothetical protein DAI22_02g297500 [Oryza sativa Japonica Group]|nr:hypothetical protein DAI22_02g297500 [Oryza sativa Japonica Group]